MGIFDGQQIAVAFCTPHRMIRLPNGQEILDTITVQWHRHRTGLALGTNCNFIQFYEDGKEIGEARDSAVRRLLAHDPQPKYLFFLDDDVLPLFDAFVKLFFRLQTEPEFDIAAGVYCVKGFHDPLIYAGDGCGPFWDWAVGDLLTTKSHGITGTHMGLTLIRTSLFQRMLDAGVVNDNVPFFKTVKETWQNKSRSGTEDLYFYQLANKVGCQIVVDTSVLAGHIDKKTGVTWGLPLDSPPAKRAKWLGGKDKEECNGELKLALDIGAGESRRQWPGYKTYTTDIRREAKPDYVQDSRLLNLPENHFDLVASSHHFEHLGRWEQEGLWKEAFKVCKPGGRVEIIVPTVEWAAHKITDGQVDEHVFNVLYGAQEAHGYERQFNTHYFGYTKSVGIALAEQAGFVDVKARDWRDEEKLGYNLIIEGKKPGPEPGVEPEANGQSQQCGTEGPAGFICSQPKGHTGKCAGSKIVEGRLVDGQLVGVS